jgi:hypothetical protein
MKQYAVWIAEELGAELLQADTISPAKLREFDCAVYGGGLYAGGYSRREAGREESL